MGVSTTYRIYNLSMWILIYSFSDTYYVWAACGSTGWWVCLFVYCRSLATLAGLILVTQHTMRSANGSTAVWTSLVWNSEAGRARDKSIASEWSVGGIANRVDGHGTAASLLWMSGGIEAGGNFPAELFASSRADKGWAVKRARPSKKMSCSGLDSA